MTGSERKLYAEFLRKDKNLDNELCASNAILSNLRREIMDVDRILNFYDIDVKKKMNKQEFIKTLCENRYFEKGERQKLVEFINTAWKAYAEKNPKITSKYQKALCMTLDSDYCESLREDYNNLRDQEDIIIDEARLQKKSYFREFERVTEEDPYIILKKAESNYAIAALCEKFDGGLHAETKNLLLSLETDKALLRAMDNMLTRFENDELKLYSSNGEEIVEGKVISFDISKMFDKTPIEIMATLAYCYEFEKQAEKSAEIGEVTDAELFEVIQDNKIYKKALMMSKEEYATDKKSYSFVKNYLSENNVRYSDLSDSVLSTFFKLKCCNLKHILSRADVIGKYKVNKEIATASKRVFKENQDIQRQNEEALDELGEELDSIADIYFSDEDDDENYKD